MTGQAFDPSRELGGRLQRAIAGPMWHGPAVDELLGRFTAATASQRPIPLTHSAWELVLHMTAWADFAWARLNGQAEFDLDDAHDFPAPPADGTPESWAAACAELQQAYARLGERVRNLPASALLTPLQNRDYSVVTLLNGVVEHATYHGGQLALLARALEA